MKGVVLANIAKAVGSKCALMALRYLDLVVTEPMRNICAYLCLKIQGGETIAIFGQGPVGLSATQLAKAMGARVLALDISNERLELAKYFGADELINSNEQDPISAIKDLTNGEGAHKTLEASSAPSARKAAVQTVRSWGIACFVGERGEVTLDVSPDLLRRQVTLVGYWTL